MRWREWLGVGERRWKKAPDEEVQPGKTLWDWLQLLVVPVILIVVTLYWSAQQTAKSDRRREDRRIAVDRAAADEARRDVTLRSYLDRMSGLMLDNGLLVSKERSAIRAVARTLTLTTLRRLDGQRKAEVVRFLYEAHLLELFDANAARPGPLVSLTFANLRNADLTGEDLRGADLTLADLRGAKLRGAFLDYASLHTANLGGADLRDASLEGARLANANLRGAELRGANLNGATNLDLSEYIARLSPEEQEAFLDSEEAFLNSLSLDELAKFNLTRKKLASLRSRAGGA